MTYIKDGIRYQGNGSIILDNTRVFNPSPEQLLAAGWAVETQPAKSLKNKLDELESALTIYVNSIARANDFDSILACTAYVITPNVYKTHAESLLMWNIECWRAFHTLKDMATESSILPTVDEFVKSLPLYVKPE